MGKRPRHCEDPSLPSIPEVAEMIEETATLLRALAAERDTLRAALQWLLNDLEDYPASARPIAAYDNARAALGEKE